MDAMNSSSNTGTEPTTVCLVISTLACGGAQRIITIMANHWASQGHGVTVVTFDSPKEAAFFPFHPGVKLLALDASESSNTIGRAILNNLHRVLRLREILRRDRPGAVISFLTTSNVLSLLAAFGVTDRVIVSERIAARSPSVGTEWFLLRWVLYHLASFVVVQSRRTIASLPRSLAHKCVVIPNPVPAIDLRMDGTAPAPVRQIIAVGRLEHQKGFDLLIEAFSTIAARHPGWNLVIYGTGPLLDDLVGFAGDLGVMDRVEIRAASREIFSEMARSSLFVLSSRYEGFPNALCEAMALGLPVISFDCPGASVEILQSGVNGLLVPDGDQGALALALDRLMTDRVEAERLGAEARKITARYSVETVMAMWERLIG